MNLLKIKDLLLLSTKEIRSQSTYSIYKHNSKFELIGIGTTQNVVNNLWIG